MFSEMAFHTELWTWCSIAILNNQNMKEFVPTKPSLQELLKNELRKYQRGTQIYTEKLRVLEVLLQGAVWHSTNQEKGNK